MVKRCRFDLAFVIVETKIHKMALVSIMFGQFQKSALYDSFNSEMATYKAISELNKGVCDLNMYYKSIVFSIN